MAVVSALKYVISEFLAHYDDRNWYRERFIHYGLGGVHRRIWPRYENSTRVMQEDWDNLIVLDACRRSVFESVVDTDSVFDEYGTIRSLGSNTGEWTIRNFCDPHHQTRFPDTVYVTANVVVSRRIDNPTFHRLDEVWKEAFVDEIGTVPPEPLVNRALEARNTYPDKRFIVHVLQPHEPFIRPANTECGYTADPGRVFKPGTALDKSNIWLDLAAGNVDVDTVKHAYRRNLQAGWREVERLIDGLSGRTVVTSDHGNMWGEPGFPFPVPIYGHPTQVRCSELVDVPWGVVESAGDRPEITDGDVRGVGTPDTDQTRAQLDALGYLT